MFYILYAFLRVISFLPMKVLYLISDFTYFFVYYLVRYRKKVVRKNLTNAFPEKTLQEIICIEKKFYHFLCDVIFEVIRQIHAPVSELKERIVFENLDLVLRHKEEGRSVMLMTSHYCNWEWGSWLALYMPDDFKLYPVYQKLKDKHFDALMLKLRSLSGARYIEKDELIRTMFNMRKSGINGVIGMISDQSPAKRNIRFRMQFLNQDTPVFLGTEQLAKKYNYPVYYVNIRRVKRGYYHYEVVPVTENPAETSEYEITTKFMKYLEACIRENPEFWLWSHNRWKHSKKD